MAIIEKPIMSKPRHRLTRRDSEHLLGSITKYTRFVVLSKMFLAGLSALMIFAIIILPVINADEEGLRIAFSTVGETADALPIMTNPSFQGVDEKNQPYLVTADSALQQDEKTIILQNVQADLLTQDQTWISVKAKKGTIQTEDKMMWLNDDVRLLHQDGYEFITDAVQIDMNARIAQGDKKVVGFGPMGELEANGFILRHDDGVLRFVNGVLMKVRTNE